MRKISFLLIGLALLIATNSNAQSAKSKKSSDGVSFGIKGGINLASQTAKSGGLSVSTSSLVGGAGGVFATLPVSDNGFSIQPELLYSMMGSKVTFSGESTNNKVNYLSVPVLAKLNFDKSGFGVYLGPQIGFLLSAKQTSGSISLDNKSDYKSTDFSGIVGLEYNLEMGLNFSARYQIGLSNVAKDADTGESLKNNAFNFSIGYNLFK